MSIEELYNSRKNNPIWNTSYPLSPEQWKPYCVENPLPFNKKTELSFYIHIPFCRQICSFCEYTRMICPDEKQQYQYLWTLYNDVSTFVSNYPDIKLRGFDIGGGTPTALSETNFYYLLQIYRKVLNCLDITGDFEPSIEGTFDTLSEKKIEMIVGSEIHRLSMGLQSTDNKVLCQHHRQNNDLRDVQKWLEICSLKGIKKINLDLMYGLKGQTAETINADLNTIFILRPQQVTIYELRTNMITDKDIPSKDVLYNQYCQYYRGLFEMGYKARFGENTFSLDDKDKGLSSYLRSRMYEGVDYKGFGISAQSMSKYGVSYNVGKGVRFIRNLINLSSFEGGDTYLLPKEEIASKYIAISAYSGSLSLRHLSNIIDNNAEDVYRESIDFCIREGLLEKNNDVLVVTHRGFEHCGAVFSLFYSRF